MTALNPTPPVALTYSAPYGPAYNCASPLAEALMGVGMFGGFMNYRRPAAYRAPDLGPNQIAWLRRMRWIDRRTVTRLPASGVTREEK